MKRLITALVVSLSICVPLTAAKNLIREDLFIRPGFDQAWLKTWPERARGLSEWRHIPSSATDNRPVKIATLGAPFPAPGLYHWPTLKMHEYTAVTRFFLTPDEKKIAARLGSAPGQHR